MPIVVNRYVRFCNVLILVALNLQSQALHIPMCFSRAERLDVFIYNSITAECYLTDLPLSESDGRFMFYVVFIDVRSQRKEKMSMCQTTLDHFITETSALLSLEVKANLLELLTFSESLIA